MKIICIHNNFNSQKNTFSNPIFYLKPDTSILNNNKPFFIPDLSRNYSCNISPVIKIKRVGKNIAEKYAHRYYEEVGVGLDLTDVSMLETCLKNNLPWEASKSFEGSAPLSFFININTITDLEKIEFSLSLNENIVKKIKIENIHFPVSSIISYISRFFTIKTGDLIFLGTPEIPVYVKINDRLQAFMGDKLFLDFYIR